MKCNIGFISEMSLKKSAIKVEELFNHIPGERIAVPDYGNLGGLIRLSSKRKNNVIPAVTLRIVMSYAMKSRIFEKVRLFAFDHQAYITLCELVTKASKNSYYESRISVQDVMDAVIMNPGLYVIIDEDCPYDEELTHDRIYVAVNGDSNLKLAIYYKKKPIFFHESIAIARKDFPTLEAITEKTIENQMWFYDNRRHFATASLIPESIENYNFFMTRELAKDTIQFGDKLPVFAEDDNALFESLVWAGFVQRYPNPPQEYKDRLEFEINVIKKMGFPAYFLIVWDFIDWAKRSGIAIGPGRGSAAGSMVAYCLGITQLCPMKHELYFERFLNPDRISMPDIDVDVSQARRGEVIKYLEEKYGEDRVSQIVALSLLKSKMAFKDACRVEGVTSEEANSVTKLWPPDKFGKSPLLEEALTFDRIKLWVDEHPAVWERAKLLEGFVRQWQVHAAGVVISPTKMTDYAPISFITKDGETKRTVQFDKNDCEKYGLLKMDLLGLKNLDILQNAAKHAGIDFYKLYDMPLDDPKVYERFQQGDTHGVFQFESRGMQDLLRRIKPGRFGDISDATALYRPGPLQAGLAEMYVKNKNSEVKVIPFIPEFETLLSDTYMTFVYQEQIMKIAREIAGFSMSKADTLRKAIGKKDKKMMGSLKAEFISGSIERGQDKEKMEKLWSDIEGFGDYCFNKSHSAAYSLISYYCMWFKVYYPREFAIALLTSDMGDSKKLSNHFMHFHKSVKFEYPKMNKCKAGYSLSEEGKLMIGLGAVKDIGNPDQYCQRFDDMTDFIQRVDLDRTKLVQLINAGFFDEVESDREALLGNLEVILGFCKNSKVAKRNFLFCMQTGMGFAIDYSKRKQYSMAHAELDAFGFNIKEGFMVRNSRIMEYMPENHMVGIISKIKRVKTKGSGADMARLEVSTDDGTHNMMVFPSVYAEYGPWLFEEQAYIFKYTVNPPKDQYDETIVVEKVMNCNEFFPKKIILFDRDGYDLNITERLPITSSGKIEVWYEGDYLSSYKSELVGYLNVLNDDVLDKIPGELDITVEVF